MKKIELLIYALMVGAAVTCWSIDMSVTNAIEASLSEEFPDWSIKNKYKGIGYTNMVDNIGYIYANKKEKDVSFDVVLSDEVWKNSELLTNHTMLVTMWTNYNCKVVTNHHLGDGTWSVNLPDGECSVVSWYSNASVMVCSDNGYHAMAFVTNIIHTLEAQK